MKADSDTSPAGSGDSSHIERQLRALLSSVRELVYYKDTSNVVLRASESMALALGLRLDEIEGKSCTQLFPAQGGRMYEHDREIIDTKECKIGILERLVTAGGVRLWVRTHKRPVFDDQGRVAGILTVSEDISEEQRFQEHLEEGSNGYRMVSDEEVLGVFRTDAHGRRIYASPGLVNFAPGEGGKLDGLAWIQALHPEDRPHLEKILARLPLSAAQAYKLEFRARRHDGEMRVLSSTAAAELDEEERVSGYVGIVSDITSKRQAEDEIREGLRRFETLAEVAPLGMYRGDSRGRTRFVNDRWIEMTGLTREEAANYGWRNALPPDERDRVLSGLEQTIPRGIPFSAEHRLIRSDGRVSWVIHHCVPEFDEEGRVSGSLGVLTDVSELKETLRENERLNNELEERVRSRTAELENANRELEAFCYSVSHDLRAPLRSIDGFSSSLMEDCGAELGNTARGYLLRVRESTHRMSSLIDELLSLSRLSRSDLHRETVDMSGLVRGICEEQLSAEPQRPMEFRIQDGVTAHGDTELLRAVLQNLIGNAWKFTGKTDTPAVEFGCENNAAGEKVYFVRDNGVGFDMAHAKRLFRAFERLHSKKEFDGTGIGLATVDRIIKRHGGRVWAESEPGCGSTFRFVLGSASTASSGG